MIDTTITTVLAVAGPFLAIGGAWGGAKVALNGTRNRVKTLETNLEVHKAASAIQHIEAIDRLARIETKIDIVISHDQEKKV